MITELHKYSAVPEPLPKKLTWIQKICRYDKDVDLLNRQVNAFSELAAINKKVSDRVQLMLSEALRDRDLHAKVADKWQEKLIDANKLKDQYYQCAEKVLYENATLGRRLKFSVGHNHIEIIVGNPMCIAKNYIHKIGGAEASVSVCNPKDTYNWKTGVIQALENLCEDCGYSKESRRDLRKALAKKYPEVFEK
jgi:hypothetical protein